MSWWTYVSGVIEVSPFGRCQAEKRYILDMVLSHLPRVSGSERDMNVYVIQKNGYNSSSSHDEFGQWSNLGNGSSWHRHRDFQTQDDYLIIVNGSLRDRMFEETLKEFNKWLCRLAKRVWVENIVVEISAYDKHYIFNNHNPYYEMLEDPSWCNKTGEPNWCEAFMWERAKNSDYPMLLGYKYYSDEENDEEAERRINYGRS